MALVIAGDLDTKIEKLIRAAASGGDESRDKGNDPIADTGSLAAADVLLRGGFLDDW